MVKDICSLCKELKVVQRNKKTGKLICRDCSGKNRRNDVSRHELCTGGCNRVRAIAKRTADGEPVCSTCYSRQRYRDKSLHEKCSGCGNVKPVATRTRDGKPVCLRCRNNNPLFHEKCSRCGNVRLVELRTDEGKPVCSGCNNKKQVGICLDCKKEGSCEEKTIHAVGLCYKHYQRQRRKKKQLALCATET